MRRRKSWAFPGCRTSSPNFTLPLWGAIRPGRSRSTVDWPQPLGQIRTDVVLFSKASESGASVKRGLSVLATFSRRIIGCGTVYPSELEPPSLNRKGAKAQRKRKGRRKISRGSLLVVDAASTNRAAAMNNLENSLLALLCVSFAPLRLCGKDLAPEAVET